MLIRVLSVVFDLAVLSGLVVAGILALRFWYRRHREKTEHDDPAEWVEAKVGSIIVTEAIEIRQEILDRIRSDPRGTGGIFSDMIARDTRGVIDGLVALAKNRNRLVRDGLSGDAVTNQMKNILASLKTFRNEVLLVGNLDDHGWSTGPIVDRVEEHRESLRQAVEAMKRVHATPVPTEDTETVS